MLDPSEYFFMNAKRRRFGNMNNTAQLKEFSEVTQTLKATTNTFRKAMEPKIQSDQMLKTRSQVVASHDARTGSKYYDHSKSQFRASAMHFLNPEANIDDNETAEVPEEVKAKRLKMDQEGQKAKLEKAREKLKKDPSKRNVTLGKNCKVRPESRVYMQKAFSDGGVFSHFGFSVGKFPGIKTTL